MKAFKAISYSNHLVKSVIIPIYFGVLRCISDIHTNLSGISSSLTRTLKKWESTLFEEKNDQKEQAAHTLKGNMIMSPMLCPPIRQKDIMVATKTYDEQLGAQFMQLQLTRPSKLIKSEPLSHNQTRPLYTAAEKEWLAFLRVFLFWRLYLKDVRLTVVKGYRSFKWLLNLAEESEGLTRWSLRLDKLDNYVKSWPVPPQRAADAVAQCLAEISKNQKWMTTSPHYSA